VPRKARVVVTGVPHHITQRGNDRRDIFFHHRDRVAYLNTLFEHAERYLLQIWGYCLMSNHVHLIAVPCSDSSLARTLGRAHADYARYANVIRRGCGHFWQARFYSCPMDENHCWQALSYVEQNPVRAKLVLNATDHLYSSARAHTGSDYPPDVDHRKSLALKEWEQRFQPEAWRQVLKTSIDDEALVRRLRESTRKGLPFACDSFTRKMEELTGKDLAERQPGRPRKANIESHAETG
jgi:putative transposase